MAQPRRASRKTTTSRPRKPPQLTSQEAVQGAKNALAVANPTVDSQLQIYAALQAATDALRREKADPDQVEVFAELTEARGELLLKVVEKTLSHGEDALAQSGVKRCLVEGLRAALDVYAVVDPKSEKLTALNRRARELSITTAKPAARPFFARFLENQNRQRTSSLQEKPEEVLVTRKAPSDHEDSAGSDLGEEVAVTLKFPSDREDGGAVTRKFPSDEEDAGCDGVFVTLKAPSDHEDQGAQGEDTVFVTLKYPSDHDEGDPRVETRKFPSDQEDTAVNTLAETPVTMKAPSDHEDQGGATEVVVTLKAPSDHEDQGQEPAPQTEKFPSDAEDAGPGGGPVTLKFPSDSEDGAHTGPYDVPDNPVTLKFPSDCEEGDDDPVFTTLKFPSDREDGGHPDPGGAVTAKFPSDQEDGGVSLGDTVVVTLKFPSDNDEGDPWIDVGPNVTTAKFPSDKDEAV